MYISKGKAAVNTQCLRPHSQQTYCVRYWQAQCLNFLSTGSFDVNNIIKLLIKIMVEWREIKITQHIIIQQIQKGKLVEESVMCGILYFSRCLIIAMFCYDMIIHDNYIFIKNFLQKLESSSDFSVQCRHICSYISND